MNKYRALILLCLLGTTLTAYTQFFVAKGQPCIFGGKVSLDTVFYTPDRAMPFDRCFYLNFRLPGNVKIDQFTILPVDQYGEKNVTRRDYHVFLKSGWPGHRPEGKKAVPWKAFSDPKNLTIRLFNEISTTPGANFTEFTLRVSPLEPNRLYKLILLTEDRANEGELKVVEDIILSGIVQRKVNPALIKQAYDNYQKIQKDRAGQKIQFQQVSFEEYLQMIFDCRQLVTLGSGNSAAIQYILKKEDYTDLVFNTTHRFVLTPAGSTAPTDDAVQHLPEDRVLTIVSRGNQLDKIALATVFEEMVLNDKKDVSGTAIMYAAGNYDIYHRAEHRISYENKRPDHVETKTLTLLGQLSVAANGSEFDLKQIIPAIGVNAVCDNKALSSFEAREASFASIVTTAQTAVTCLTPTVMRYIMEQAIQCPCEEKGVKDITQKDDLLRSISFFTETTGSGMSFLLNGTISLKDLYNPVEQNNYPGRVTNIKASIKQVQDLKEFILKTNARATSIALSPILACLDGVEASLNDVKNQLTNINGNINARYAFYKDNLSMKTATQLAGGSTAVLDFVSANKFRIIPDFGMLLVFRGEGLRVQDLTPYLGFHINFRSIDKSIEMKHVPYKSWKHYFSFMAGITLTSMKIEGKRENFFGNNNLITGFGFRLNNFLRVTGGAIWFRTIDKNPLSTDKPVAFSPFAGLSLDLELQDLFGGIKNLFK